jgi:hypothetical protein
MRKFLFPRSSAKRSFLKLVTRDSGSRYSKILRDRLEFHREIQESSFGGVSRQSCDGRKECHARRTICSHPFSTRPKISLISPLPPQKANNSKLYKSLSIIENRRIITYNKDHFSYTLNNNAFLKYLMCWG